MWNVPNLLTLARIVAVVPLVFMIEHAAWLAALIVFFAAAITDWLDGFLARRWHQQSNLGRFLDPIADKLIVAAVLIALGTFAAVGIEPSDPNSDVVPSGEPHWRPSAWATVAIVSREIFVAGLREFLGLRGVVVHVTPLAKWKTATQLVAIGLLLLSAVLLPWPDVERAIGRSGQSLLILSAVLAWITAFAYLRAGLRHMELPR